MRPGGEDNDGYLEPGDRPRFDTHGVCVTCHRTFARRYPSQKYCSLACLPRRASWDREARREAIRRNFPRRERR